MPSTRVGRWSDPHWFPPAAHEGDMAEGGQSGEGMAHAIGVCAVSMCLYM